MKNFFNNLLPIRESFDYAEKSKELTGLRVWAYDQRVKNKVKSPVPCKAMGGCQRRFYNGF